MSTSNWFIENIPVLGPIVGAAGVIVSGFLYQDKKIGKKVDKDDFVRTIKDVKGHIEGSGKAVNQRITDLRDAVNKRIDDKHKAVEGLLKSQTKSIIAEIKNNGKKR